MRGEIGVGRLDPCGVRGSPGLAQGWTNGQVSDGEDCDEGVSGCPGLADAREADAWEEFAVTVKVDLGPGSVHIGAEGDIQEFDSQASGRRDGNGDNHVPLEDGLSPNAS